MYPDNDYRSYLEHHGILGMKWGVQNGPPYPLGISDHNASERKAGWMNSLKDGFELKSSVKNLVKDYKRNFNEDDPFKTSDSFNSSAEKLLSNSYKRHKKDLDDRYEKFIKATNDSAKYEKQFNKLANKYAKEYYDANLESYLKKTEGLMSKEKAKDKLKADSFYYYGYDKAASEFSDIYDKAFNASDIAWNAYNKTCSNVAKETLGKYNDMTVYKPNKYTSVTIGDILSLNVASMHSKDTRKVTSKK